MTATYYLLLKKHMIRQIKNYVDAFMELQPIEDNGSGSQKSKPGELLDVENMQAQLSQHAHQVKMINQQINKENKLK